MSVQTEIDRIIAAVGAAYDAVEAKGGTAPAAQTIEGLAGAISGIETGGGGDNADGVIDKSVVNITSDAAEVGQYAFYGCEQLETVSFPMATKIQGASFGGCKALVSVSAPKVTEITGDVTDYFHFDIDGNYMKNTVGAFSGCINLTTADLPAAVTIGDSAFSGCINLTTADLPAAETIYIRAFSDCEGLTELKFPRVKTIGA